MTTGATSPTWSSSASARSSASPVRRTRSPSRSAGPIPSTPKDTGSAGTTVNIPPGAADIPFPNAQNLNIGDVLLKTAPLEIFGTISFAMERDGVFSSCHVTDALNSALVGVIKDSLELLIANSAGASHPGAN